MHGDFRLDNTVIAAEAPEVRAVLDWELSTLGRSPGRLQLSPHEVAHAGDRHPGASTGSLVGHDLAALGIPAMADYVDAYVARDRARSAGIFRLISPTISSVSRRYQGIVGRVRDTPAKAAMVRPLAAIAWSFAREAGK